MVISFSLDKPRAQLVNKGIVYTVRKKRRKQTGRTWWNKGRTLHKEGDVDISECGEVQPHDLRGYAYASGFNTTQEWYDAIVAVNKWSELKPDTKLWLYAVYSLIECPRCDGEGDVSESEFNWILCPRCRGSKMIRGIPSSTDTPTSPGTANSETTAEGTTGESLELCGSVPGADRNGSLKCGRPGSRKASRSPGDSTQ